MQAMNPIAKMAQALVANTGHARSAEPELGNTPRAQAGGIAFGRDAIIDATALRLKQRLLRKALWGSASSLIPLPLIDLAVDIALLSSMLDEVHQTLGLSAAQLAELNPNQRHKTFAAIQWVGNRAIGQWVTATVVKRLVAGMGLKLTTAQLSKAVPVAGQIASAALNYSMLRYLVTRHIDDCVKVLKRVNANADSA